MKVKITKAQDNNWYKVDDIIEVENRASWYDNRIALYRQIGNREAGVDVLDCEILEEPAAQIVEFTIADAIDLIQEHMQESCTAELGLTIFPDDDSVINYGDRMYFVSKDDVEETLNSIYALSEKEYQGD